MNIEILLGEMLLYGDIFNAKLLEQTFPKAKITWTRLGEDPAFAREKQDIIYMGAIPDDQMVGALKWLEESREALAEHLESGRLFLSTGNSGDLFGSERITDTGREKMLGFFPYHADQSFEIRYNSWLMGQFGSFDLFGNKSEFSVLFAEDPEAGFIRLEHGLGLNREGKTDGYHEKGFYTTRMLGPFLVLNPLFAEHILSEAAGEAVRLPYRDDMLKAREIRKKKLLMEVENNFGETNIVRVEN